MRHRPSRGTGYELVEEVEELPDDAILEQDLRSAPAHPAPAEEEIVELGQDAIVGEGREAHRPQPRARVLQEYSSIVIADEARDFGPSPSDQTVVVRERRPMPRRTAPAPVTGTRASWLVVGAFAAALGLGVVVWLSTRDTDSSDAVPFAAEALDLDVAEPLEPAARRVDAPPVASVDQLPVVRTRASEPRR